MMAAYLVERGSPFGLEHNPRASGETPHRLPHERNCVSCDQLREEIAYLRSELGLSDKLARTDAYRAAFGITAQQARTLMALVDAKGRCLSFAQLEDAMERRYFGEARVCAIYVCRLRKVLGHDAIETVSSLGYRVTESGLETVRKAIGPDQCSPSKIITARWIAGRANSLNRKRDD